MKISFVIPAFNEEKNIVECVKSIQAEIARTARAAPLENEIGQKFEHEIIVVNNNSTDRTKEFALAQGATVVDEPRKGIVWARKAGFEASTGEIVANIDADNRLPEGWLRTVQQYFSADTELLALSGPLVYYDSSFRVRFWTKAFYGIGYIFNWVAEFFGKNSMFQGGNYVVRREAIQRIGGYDTTIEFYGEDTDIGRRLAKIGKIVWTFELPINSSGRRMEKEGMILMGFKYGINYLWISFFKKPFHQRHIDIRKP